LKLNHDVGYRRALQQADLAIADSELLVVVWRAATGRKLRKISGISYLRSLLEHGISKRGGVFWVVSSDSAKEKAFRWLAANGVLVEEQDFYVTATREAKTEDYALLMEIEKRQPLDVIIAIGAGLQERLGLYLRDYLHCQPKPNIHCIGAALGFLTGDQPPISEWADRHNVGWLPRLLSQPRLLIPRIGIAIALIGMTLKYRSELPPLRSRWTEM
jgi:UDP-N-acetyl-D-mannosaminuronic acid transferase (WecB/TagA/CpsF family)